MEKELNRVSFSEKKFKEWFTKARQDFGNNSEITESARWGFDEATRERNAVMDIAIENSLRIGSENAEMNFKHRLKEATDTAFKDGFRNGSAEGTANGTIMGYDLAVAERKARDAQREKKAYQDGYRSGKRDAEIDVKARDAKLLKDLKSAWSETNWKKYKLKMMHIMLLLKKEEAKTAS